MPDRPSHIPVLLDETLAMLDPREGEVFADATAGLGGHASAVAQRLGAGGTLVLNDLDPENLTKAEARVRADCAEAGLPCPTILALRANFADLPRTLGERGIAADMLLADLGFASSQMDDPERGMSFRSGGPLDMRLDRSAEITAEEIVNSWPERELADLIFRYGEERSARRIAAAIVRARAEERVSTTADLAAIVREALGGGRPERGRRSGKSIDPATKTFQAIRIAVNDELGSLESLLSAISRAPAAVGGAVGWLSPGARVAVISFHSLEDRPVKRAFAELVSRGLAEEIARGVVRPSEGEVERNPRSRSAKLRGLRLAAGMSGAAGEGSSL
ncbi:MAG: 16S rRNA (cytosine(1402)-N(4))-methyltransferase RsmH [Phycisphaerales bacterium]|nr:16S rRNA (cytosine(1402)-N(4))-methyltransferase RsmH [Phycisphaerales bacterium]